MSGKLPRWGRQAAAAVLAVTLMTAAAASLQEQLFSPGPPCVDLSSQYPTFFRFTRDPEVICFLPGNLGAEIFQSSAPTTSPSGDGGMLKELKCNGQVIVLDHPSYRVRAVGSAATTDKWWEALAAAVTAGAAQRHVLDLRLTDSLLNHLREAGEGSLQEFGYRLAGLLASCDSLPLLSCEVSGAAQLQAADRLRDLLKKELPDLRMGRVLTELPTSHTLLRSWDFVIADPEILPEWLQGQAAVSAFHARVGPMPVILRFSRPDFYRDMIALATGAAGFQYTPPTTEGPRERALTFRQLRAFTTMKNRLRDGKVCLMPEQTGPGILGALGVPGETYCLLLLRGAQVSFTPPMFEARPDYVAWWYRAATDETIVLPRQSRRADSTPETLSLVPPSHDGAWIYCHELLPAAEDWETTTPAVTSLSPSISLQP